MTALTRLNIQATNLGAIEKKSANQEQTESAFSFKWSKRNTYESESFKATVKNFLFERYCANDPSRLDAWLEGDRKIILDAGCGSGYSAMLFFGDHLYKHDYLGVDISDAVDIARQRFQEAGYPGDFLRCDLLQLLIPPESVDLIFAEGVLHHTDSTEKAIKTLVTHLKPGGRFLFYVYAKKAVIREFTDDHIRQALQNVTDEEAWKALEPLTRLGVALGELKVTLTVPEDIPYLGIRQGEIDLQRFFYWNICKLFYHPQFSLEEMNHVNFDWFRPLNCHRQTPEEVAAWCSEAGLSIEHLDTQESGITVVARK